MGRILIYAAFIIALVLITFFGLGPVLFADGTTTERVNTLWVVILLYVVAIATFYIIYKKIKKY